jgi:hypothetical protein
MNKLQKALSKHKEKESTKDKILTTRSNEIELTDDQKAALMKVADFIEDKESRFFMLAGYSGTGKTTIAENIVGYVTKIKKKSISLLAPTNAAKNRISEKIKMPYKEASTIHRALYSVDERGKFVPNGGFSSNYYIIDECSMIDVDVLRQIILKVIYGLSNCKIIFMGDIFQLEPVGENPKLFEWENIPLKTLYSEKTEEQLRVPVFFEKNKHELTEVKRYDGPLLKIATDIRTYQKPVYNEIDTNDLRELPKFSSVLPKLIAADGNYMIITSTNKQRIYYNNEVRKFKFSKQEGVDLNYPQNHENFVAINNSVYFSNGETFKPKNLMLIEEFELKLIQNATEFSRGLEEPIYKRLKAMLYIDKTFNTKFMENTSKYILMLPSIEESSLHGSTIVYNTTRQHTILSTNVESVLITSFMNPRTGKEVTMFNKEVIIATYGYAISGHKAQGQEWDYVFIDGSFISSNWDAGKWYYTAITRAKKKVEVKTNKYLSVIPKDAVMEK